MNTSANEYLPTEAPTFPPPSEHKKVFRLTPAEDDLTAIILTVRLQTIEQTELTRSSRLLFVYLLDLSLRRSVNVRPGVVAISITKLSERLGASRRTVSRWLTELKRRDLVWVSGLFIPNAWAINTYHLSAIDPQGTHQAKTTPEGMWGNGHLRGKAPYRHQCLAGSNQPQKSQVPDLATPSGQECPAPVDTSVYGQWTPVSTGAGHLCPLPVDTNVHGDRTFLSTARGHQCPAPVDTSGTLKKTEDVESRASEESSLYVQRSSTPSQRPGRAKSTGAENVFLLDVRAMCDRWHKGHGQAELANSGGWWRMAFRSDPELMRRVLAETLRAVKESEVKTTPGQYAADLWKRWNGKIAPAVDAMKAVAAQADNWERDFKPAAAAEVKDLEHRLTVAKPGKERERLHRLRSALLDNPESWRKGKMKPGPAKEMAALAGRAGEA